jgi:GNAT superfamily N-acetyltransferase
MIRRARPEEADTLAALFRRSYRTLTFLPILHTPEEDREHFRKIVREQDVWVAEEDGEIGGFVALDGNLGTFFYVDPDAHGRGIGSALFEHVQRERSRGFSFWAFQKNEAARRFYEKRGCVAVEFTKGEGNEEKEPDVRYEWRPNRGSDPAPAESS